MNSARFDWREGVHATDLAKLHPGALFYLATPYRAWAHGEESAFDAACLVAGRLVLEGLHVYAPIAHFHPIARAIHMEFHDAMWIAADKPFIERSDVLLVARLAGWTRSNGVKQEFDAFLAAKKPRYLIHPALLRSWSLDTWSEAVIFDKTPISELERQRRLHELGVVAGEEEDDGGD